MPVYILLSTLTVQGVQTLKSNPERLRAVNQDVEELGCKVLHQWATLGEFDFINVVEAPDEATIARVSVSLGARGSTKIQTLPALPIDKPTREPTWEFDPFIAMTAPLNSMSSTASSPRSRGF